MKYICNRKGAFTLVELIVSITIFTVMMVSVATIFLFSSQMSTRVELNRMMQENIKNVVEDIAESVRIGGLEGTIALGGSTSCGIDSSSGSSLVGFKLCMVSGEEYVLGYKNDITGDWEIISDVKNCELINETNSATVKNCRILKRYNNTSDYFPLTNSFIDFQDVQFIVTNTDIPMVKMIFTMRPSYTKGILKSIIKNNIVSVQTTVSERFISTQ